jgi:hypothetical protein
MKHSKGGQAIKVWEPLVQRKVNRNLRERIIKEDQTIVMYHGHDLSRAVPWLRRLVAGL